MDEAQPVAWMSQGGDVSRSKTYFEEMGFMNLIPLYTTPPKREWVDLSDSQIERVYHDVAKLHRGAAMPWGQIQFGRALQALIKEKNNG